MALPRDQEASFRASRIRMPKSGGATVVQPTPPHTHHASEIIAEPEPVTALLSGDDVQQDLEEIGVEKLARSGEQPMLGALDMNHFDVNNIDDADIEGTATVGVDVVFTGGEGVAKITNPRDITMRGDALGEAQVSNVRQLHFTGDHGDGEAVADGLERVVFNDEPTASSIEMPSRIEMNVVVNAQAGGDYTIKNGLGSWSAVERTFGWWVESGGQGEEPPVSFFMIMAGWTVKLGWGGPPPE